MYIFCKYAHTMPSKVMTPKYGQWNRKYKKKTFQKTSTLGMTISCFGAFLQNLLQIFSAFMKMIEKLSGNFD